MRGIACVSRCRSVVSRAWVSVMVKSAVGTHNLFFREPQRRQQVHSFLVPEVDINAQQEYEEELAHILFLFIAIKFFTW